MGYTDNRMEPTLSPSSPDMNPIEDFWAEMKRRVAMEPRPANQLELIKTAEKVFWGFTKEELAPYIKSIPRRLRQVKLRMGFPQKSHLLAKSHL